MEQALDRMKSLIGHAIEWGSLEQFMPEVGWMTLSVGGLLLLLLLLQC